MRGHVFQQYNYVRAHVIPGYAEKMSAEVERSGVEAWEMLLRAHAALVPTLSREVEEASGVPLSWYDVLLELSRAPEHRLRMTELGERVVLSRTRVSRIVDEMVRVGLVTKRADPDDGRASHTVLTPKGRAALRRAAPHYLRGIDLHFGSHLGPDELKAVTRGLARVLEAES